MARAKRNSRQQGAGGAPTPTPAFYWAGDIATGAGEVSISVRKVMAAQQVGGGIVTLDEIQISGQTPKVYARLVADGVLSELPLSRIDSSSGTATVTWSTTGIAAADYNLVSLGWDPAVRGNVGEWVAPFSFPFTAV